MSTKNAARSELLRQTVDQIVLVRPFAVKLLLAAGAMNYVLGLALGILAGSPPWFAFTMGSVALVMQVSLSSLVWRGSNTARRGLLMLHSAFIALALLSVLLSNGFESLRDAFTTTAGVALDLLMVGVALNPSLVRWLEAASNRRKYLAGNQDQVLARSNIGYALCWLITPNLVLKGVMKTDPALEGQYLLALTDTWPYTVPVAALGLVVLCYQARLLYRLKLQTS